MGALPHIDRNRSARLALARTRLAAGRPTMHNHTLPVPVIMLTRVCSECGLAKPDSAYYATRKTRKCKACELIAGKRRYESNKDEKLKRCAEYRAANKTKIKHYMARRYEETKAEWLARTKAYQARPEVKARNKVRLI